jgi:excisionase family DNA binding protein
MSAYATSLGQLRGLPSEFKRAHTDAAAPGEPSVIDDLISQLVERVTTAVVERLTDDGQRGDEWFDSRHAADYLGVHRDTLRKLAAERAIPSEQDGPGCKLYFRRSDLDAWRRGGGRPSHLAAAVRQAV